MASSSSNDPQKSNSQPDLGVSVYFDAAKYSEAKARTSFDSRKQALEIENYELENALVLENLREKRRWYASPTFIVTALGSIVGILFSTIHLVKFVYDVSDLKQENERISKDLFEKTKAVQIAQNRTNLLNEQIGTLTLAKSKLELEIGKTEVTIKTLIGRIEGVKVLSNLSNSVDEYESPDGSKVLTIRIGDWSKQDQIVQAIKDVLSSTNDSSFINISASIHSKSELELLSKAIEDFTLDTLSIIGTLDSSSLDLMKDWKQIGVLKLNTEQDESSHYSEWFEFTGDAITRHAISGVGVSQSFLDFDFSSAKGFADSKSDTVVQFGQLLLDDLKLELIDSQDESKLLELIKRRAILRHLSDGKIELDLTSTQLSGPVLDRILSHCTSLSSLILNDDQLFFASDRLEVNTSLQRLRIVNHSTDGYGVDRSELSVFLRYFKSLKELTIPIELLEIPSALESCPQLSLLRVTNVFENSTNQLRLLKDTNTPPSVIVQHFGDEYPQGLSQKIINDLKAKGFQFETESSTLPERIQLHFLGIPPND